MHRRSRPGSTASVVVDYTRRVDEWMASAPTSPSWRVVSGGFTPSTLDAQPLHRSSYENASVRSLHNKQVSALFRPLIVAIVLAWYLGVTLAC
jgi:hypothetical protein